MVFLNKGEARAFLFGICRRINALLFIFFLMISIGCSTFTSSVFFVPQKQDTLFHDVERGDWITTNQGYGTVRPPLKSININGDDELTIYPILSTGHIEMFGPPLLPIIWIPEFLCLPPLDPLNVLHLIYTGAADDVRIEFINDMPIPQNCLKRKMREGETHFYLSIPAEIVKEETFSVNISVEGNVIFLKFNKSRSKNWFPLVAPL